MEATYCIKKQLELQYIKLMSLTELLCQFLCMILWTTPVEETGGRTVEDHWTEVTQARSLK